MLKDSETKKPPYQLPFEMCLGWENSLVSLTENKLLISIS